MYPSGLKNIFDEFVIEKLTGKTELKEELNELFAYFGALQEYMLGIRMDLALYPLPQPNNIDQNPWKHFIGEFQTWGVQCFENGKEVGLETVSGVMIFDSLKVVENAQGQMILEFSTPTQWQQVHSYNGAGDVVGGATVSVHGSKTSAIRDAEYMHLWSNRWIKKSWELKKMKEGHKVIWKQKIGTRDWNDDLRLIDTKRCVFSGTFL